MTIQSKLEKDFFLTDEEYYRKRANLIEELKQCAIDLNYTPRMNSVYEYTKELEQKPTTLDPKNFKKIHSYGVNIQDPIDENIPKKTAVYHELSHVLWDSFVSGSIEILRDWAQLTTENLMAKYGLTKNIPSHLQSNVEQMKVVIQSFIKEIYMNCFNSLEDQRIESLTQNVWLATRGMFRKATTSCGNAMSEKNMNTPSDHFLAARFHRPELTTKVWADALHRVEGTGMSGAIAVMSEVKELIDKHIEENLKKQLNNTSTQCKQGGKISTPINVINQYIEKQNGTNTVQGQAKEYTLRVKRYEEAIKQSSRTPEEKQQMKTKIDKYKKYAVTKRTKPKTEGEKKIEESAKAMEEQQEEVNRCATNLRGQEQQEKTARKLKNAGHIASVNTNILGNKKLGKGKINRALKISVEESAKEGKQELSRMLEKIYGQAVPSEPAYIVEGVSRQQAIPNIDNEVARQLARTFNKIQQTKRTAITENGSEVDIEAVLQAQAKGFGDYMIDDVKYRGLTIYISVDGSGSMSHLGHMETARDLIATMFKAVERTPQVKMLVNVWSSDTKGQVGITAIKNTNDCKNIGMTTNNYMYTPTHEAIRYTAKQLSRVSGKKLMIILTDGHPQYHMNGRSLDNETLVQMAIREQRKAQKIVHSMVCININAGEAVSKENLKRIFKKNYVEFNGMEQAKKFVMKNFKQAVFTALRT